MHDSSLLFQKIVRWQPRKLYGDANRIVCWIRDRLLIYHVCVQERNGAVSLSSSILGLDSSQRCLLRCSSLSIPIFWNIMTTFLDASYKTARSLSVPAPTNTRSWVCFKLWLAMGMVGNLWVWQYLCRLTECNHIDHARCTYDFVVLYSNNFSVVLTPYDNCLVVLIPI